MPLGMGPSKLFSDISNTRSETKPLILSGILPKKLLLYMFNELRAFGRPMLYGISSINLFESKYKLYNESIFPIVLGIVTLKLLLERIRFSSVFILVIASGMVPLNLLSLRYKVTS